jgi:catechol 2,3-dioxygenase-like lactoylglutathione lyase family enzyme
VDFEVGFTGVPVSTLAGGRDYFARLFGRAPDVVASEDEVLWQVAGPAWLYVKVDPPRAGNALAALAVADLDRVLADLEGRGIRPTVVEDLAAGRKATLYDPDGNTVAIIEVA